MVGALTLFPARTPNSSLLPAFALNRCLCYASCASLLLTLNSEGKLLRVICSVIAIVFTVLRDHYQLRMPYITPLQESNRVNVNPILNLMNPKTTRVLN